MDNLHRSHQYPVIELDRRHTCKHGVTGPEQSPDRNHSKLNRAAFENLLFCKGYNRFFFHSRWQNMKSWWFQFFFTLLLLLLLSKIVYGKKTRLVYFGHKRRSVTWIKHAANRSFHPNSMCMRWVWTPSITHNNRWNIKHTKLNIFSRTGTSLRHFSLREIYPSLRAIAFGFTFYTLYILVCGNQRPWIDSTLHVYLSFILACVVCYLIYRIIQ